LGVSFTDSNIGTIVGFNGTILRTTDGGQNWNQQFSKISINLNAVCFVDSNIGYITGGGGTILKTVNGGIITDVEEKKIRGIIEDFSISQNYPNPFNPSTTVRYNIPEKSFVTIKIYDILGKEVATLINEEKPIGNYTVKFDGSGLTSGIYFYQIKAGNYVETKKMILLK
jgi:hypothetical protein